MLNGPRSRILAEGLQATLLLLLAPALLLAVAYLIGTRLPEDHTATASGIVQAPPERVAELLNDFSAQVNWRNGPLILARGPIKAKATEHCWLEGWLLAKIIFCTAETSQPSRRIVQTDTPSLPFAATWNFVLYPASTAATATSLTITEQSTIDPPLWRFFGRYILRRHTAAAQYLSDLQAEALRHP